MSRVRAWLLTHFIPSVEEGEIFIDLLKEVDNLRYFCAQVEQCPNTMNLHVQGYIVFNAAKTMSAVKKLIGNSIHLEPRRGSDQEAVDYCSKEDTRVTEPVEWGERLHQGVTSDLHSVCSAIMKGEIKSQDELISQAPSTYCRNRNGLRDILGASIKKRTKAFRTLTVEIYYGEAGTGKTRKAYEENEFLYSLEQSANGQDVWFDGYEGETVLLIDDFYGWIRFAFILKMLDGYRLKLPVKGSYTWAEWDKVIITSNSAPWEWYRWSENMNWGAFQRRITKVVHFTKNNEPQDTTLHLEHHCHTNPRGSVCTCFNE